MSNSIKININHLTVFLFFLLSIIIFFLLETNLFVKIVFLVISIIFSYLNFISSEKSYLTYLSFFFGSTSLFYLYLNQLWPLWANMLVFVLLLLLVAYFISYKYKVLLGFPRLLSIVSLEILILSEVELALIAWTIDPKSKAAILLAILYFFWEIVIIQIKESISLKKISFQILVTVLVIASIIITSSWYGY